MSTDPVVIEAVNATSVADAQAIAKEIGIEFAAEHLTWCEYVWSKGARFAVFPGRLLGKGVGIVAARDIEVRKTILIYNTSKYKILGRGANRLYTTRTSVHY